MRTVLLFTALLGLLSQFIFAQAALAQSQTVAVPNSPGAQVVTTDQGFPNKNGPFSALMLVIPAEELIEFDKPSDQGLQLSQVTRAETGAQLAVKIVFMGMGLDAEQKASVVYDLKIIGPDGKIYDESDYHGLTGIKSTIANPTAVFDSGPEVVMLKFEPKDMAGVYTLKATVRDEVSGRSVALSYSLEHINSAAPPTQAKTAKPKSKARKGKKRRR